MRRSTVSAKLLPSELSDVLIQVVAAMFREHPLADALLNLRAKWNAVIERHCDEELAFIRFVDLMDVANVGVVKCGRGFGLVDEPLLVHCIGGQMSRQEFQRDEAVELQVLGFIENPHAPLAELLEDFVMGYGLADQSRSRSILYIEPSAFDIGFPATQNTISNTQRRILNQKQG